MKVLFTKLWVFITALNRSKVVHGIGTFFAVCIPALIIFQQNLPEGWQITLGIASVVGILSRAQFIWQKVVPLLDGSSVIEVKPPTAPGVRSLRRVEAPQPAVPEVKTTPTPVTRPERGQKTS